MDITYLEAINKQIRANILECTTAAGTGHPTSSLSAVEIMSTIMFGGFFHTDLENIDNPNNDRLIFSKGHASPLFYSLYAAAGKVSQQELLTFRQLHSNLEGHPTPNFRYTEATTGSLGQGLGIGIGMALASKVDNHLNKTWVLLGDSELAEGSIWEALNSGAYYRLDNVIAIVDLNRLGQRGQTQIGHHSEILKAKTEAFDWETYVVNGHDINQIIQTLELVTTSASTKPKIIIAETIKGKGVSFLEDKEGWHGKALNTEQYTQALAELTITGPIDYSLVASVNKPLEDSPAIDPVINPIESNNYEINQLVATRKAYGETLVKLGQARSDIVVLDAEMNNSTYAEFFAKQFPKRYFEMFIAEQNMVSVAMGLSKRGKKPFISTFAAFLTRAFDQLRMSQYSKVALNVMGSHCGVSIGPDGSSQMAVEDIAMMRAIHNSVVLYPSDAVSTEKLMIEMIKRDIGLNYLRGTRAETPVIYSHNEQFPIGGSKTLKESNQDAVTIFAAGITLFEALKAYDILQAKGVNVRVVDMYSVKPIDTYAIKKACNETQALLVVEDHYREGGIYSSIVESGAVTRPTHSLAVTKISHSGTPAELLHMMEIDAEAIVNNVLTLL